MPKHQNMRVIRTDRINDTYTYYVISGKNHGYFTVYNRTRNEKVVSTLILNGARHMKYNGKVFDTLKEAKSKCLAEFRIK